MEKSFLEVLANYYGIAPSLNSNKEVRVKWLVCVSRLQAINNGMKLHLLSYVIIALCINRIVSESTSHSPVILDGNNFEEYIAEKVRIRL